MAINYAGIMNQALNDAHNLKQRLNDSTLTVSGRYGLLRRIQIEANAAKVSAEALMRDIEQESH